MKLNFLVFFTLAMATTSFWLRRSIWLWGGFLITSLILAVTASVANPFSLIAILGLAGLHFLFVQDEESPQHWLYFFLITIISVFLILHWMPGFHNWHIEGKLWLNYDKPFIGFFVLAWHLSLLKNGSAWLHMLLKAVPLILLGIAAMIVLAITNGAIVYDFKWPPHLLLRLVSNLFFVTIPEEAFYRGFFQRFLTRKLGSGILGATGSLVLTSLLFTVLHLQWGAPTMLLSFVFLASLIYGLIYHITRSIEAAILCHVSLNAIHMIFFSYHAL